jgi:AraC-like DNA-binding protein
VYQLRPPAAPLRPYIEHYWSVAPDGDAPVDLQVNVFVDARADLVFNFGAAYARQVLGAAPRRYRRSNFDAQRLRPIRITQRGAVAVCGVRFHLGGVGPFARGPLAAWTDLTPAPADVFGADVVALEEALRATDDLDVRAAHLDAFFLRALAEGASQQRFARALAALVASDGGASVAAVAESVGVSSRQLGRLFAQHLGVAPKVVAQVLRFQGALRSLMRDPGCALADIAARCGYFDQAHFVRDFRRFTGGVPRGYRGYYPPAAPSDFAPNVVLFVQDGARSGA